MRAVFPLIILIIISCGKTSGPVDEPVSVEDADAEISRIAFGSCSREDLEQTMWTAVLKSEPDLWIWLGDNIYGDSHDMEVMRSKYSLQKKDTNYQKILESMPVIGTWDDHDYGVNDGGKYYSMKGESKKELLDFLDVEESNPVWEREGVYQSYDFGSDERMVKVILLDTRYFRDTLDPSPEEGVRYLPNPQGDVLGEDQWQWLEAELRQSNAALNIIGSGFQIIPEEHGFEKWANFPSARARLFELLQEVDSGPVLLISGDRHIAEVSLMELEDLSYPLYDFTSSGLTHTWSEEWEESNRYRSGDLIIKKNFGIIEIDWSEPLKITLEVRGENDSLFQSISIQY